MVHEYVSSGMMFSSFQIISMGFAQLNDVIVPIEPAGAPGLVLPLGCFETLVEHLFYSVLFARWPAPHAACREW